MLYEKTLNAIKAHAEAEYPNESCGLIVAVGNKEKYIPCKNCAPKGTDNFQISPQQRAEAEDIGQILAVVHSHPDWQATPSPADLVMCEQDPEKLPWVIVSVIDGVAGDVHQFAPSGYSAPLVGRPFFHGVLDCYTLIRDFYVRELSITLPDFERPDNWWNEGKNLYIEGFEIAGFVEVKDLQPFDVILMAVNSKVANHAAVYLDTTQIKEIGPHVKVPNCMLHHLYGRLSDRAVYGGYWADNTVCVIRHKEFIK